MSVWRCPKCRLMHETTDAVTAVSHRCSQSRKRADVAFVKIADGPLTDAGLTLIDDGAE